MRAVGRQFDDCNLCYVKAHGLIHRLGFGCLPGVAGPGRSQDSGLQSFPKKATTHFTKATLNIISPFFITNANKAMFYLIPNRRTESRHVAIAHIYSIDVVVDTV